MKKKEVKPLFGMTYAALEQLGDKAVRLITRDINELSAYGINEETAKAVSKQTQTLKDFPTDEELEGEISDKTEAKNKAADVVKIAIRAIMIRVGNGFGENSGKYRKFGTQGLNEFTDDELVRCANRVVRMSKLYMNDLQKQKLTQEVIDDLVKKNKTFDDAIDAKDDAITDRDIATEERINAGNSLYTEIVRVFEAGKNYWVDKNEAKYNDYVIYDEAGVKEELPAPPPAPPEEPK